MVYTEILNKNKDFLTLYRKGKSIVSKAVVIYFRPNGLPFNRFGITAGKKVGNAVMRNRAKRIIRQAYRENELLFPLGIDIVFVARKYAAEVKEDYLSAYVKKYALDSINSYFASLEETK
ncbi:MAG: ribonuclease P protein component [Oscillospiraceae bacterium]|nr:ribonuclease P protein component [Oscillospiraceae bacterium]